MIADSSDPCFRVRDLSFAYPKGDGTAIDGLTFDIPQGAVTAVVGLRGSGKSTLLSLLGLLWEDGHPFSGTITYREAAEPYHRLDQHSRTSLRQRSFGFALQNVYLLPNFSCLDNVAMPLVIQGQSLDESRRQVREMLRQIDAELVPPTDADDRSRQRALSVRAEKKPAEVSGGERQQFALLRALIHGPRLLFADEPVSNLDFRSQSIIEGLLRSWQEQKSVLGGAGNDRTLVLISHQLDFVLRLAEHLIVLYHGRLVGNQMWHVSELPRGEQSLRHMIETGNPDS